MTHSGGRLGNSLSTYVQTRWMSHQYGLPFIYAFNRKLEPFKLSCQSEKSQIYDLSKYEIKILKTKNVPRKIRRPERNRIYVQPPCYLSPSRIEEMKKDPVFLKAIREEISPKKTLELISPPPGMPSIAVHLRKGGGFDKPLKSVQIFHPDKREVLKSVKDEAFDDTQYPLKLPPEQFYIDQLKKLGEELQGQQVYVFIFTDDQNPKILTDRVQKEVGLGNFQFHCRTGTVGHDKNVLEDFFSMPNFDYFLFPHSTFSNIATLLGDYKVIIYPKQFHWERDTAGKEYLIIDKAAWSRS